MTWQGIVIGNLSIGMRSHCVQSRGISGGLRRPSLLAMAQVSFIDVSKESPCGHGTVICFSVFCGAGAHFGELVDGQPADGAVQNELWVDTLVDDQKDQVNDQGRPCSHEQAAVMPGHPRVWRSWSHVLHARGRAA